MDLVALAEGFCKAAHFFPNSGERPQLRKYTFEPYWHHCREVAHLVARHNHRSHVIAAAWLHDVLEDTGIDVKYLRQCFGDEITNLVLEVTDVSKPTDGNRQKRKELDRVHLAKTSVNGATIKLADLISNTKSIAKHDPDFARTYLAEKWQLLQILQHGNVELHMKALWALEQAEKDLVQHALGKKL